MKALVSALTLASVAGIASAQAVQVGPGAPVDSYNDGFTNRSTLWDNGDTDGTNGYSQATSGVFGAYRATVDDFVVSDAAGWRLNSFSTLGLWTSGAAGIGTGYNLWFHADNSGAPGSVVATANVTSYAEARTGRTWFSRPEVAIDVTFDDVILAQGTYWVQMQVIGPENHFQMVRSQVTGSEMWINYADFGGLMPGSAVFGAAADAAYSLGGEVVPAPASLALLGLGGLAAARRRR